MILESAKKEAIESLKHFFYLLGLDHNLFNHLYYINIIVGKTEKNSEAVYYPYENYIVINKSYLDKMFNKLIYNPKDSQKIISNISSTLVHEILHANRAIFIKNSINSISLKARIDEEKTKSLQEERKIKTEEYDMLLDNMLNKPYSYKFRKYIPIKIKFNKDHTYSVIAYNRITKNYDCFNNQKFNINNDNDRDLLIQEISNELAENKSKHPVSDTIISFNKSAEQQKITVVANHYCQQQSIRLENDKRKIINRFEIIDGLEEALTDLVADIIIMNRNNTILDLENIAKKIYNSNTLDLYEKLAMHLTTIIGEDLIKWFILATYDDDYKDLIAEKFKDDYDELLNYFHKIYYDRNKEYLYGYKLDNILKSYEILKSKK